MKNMINSSKHLFLALFLISFIVFPASIAESLNKPSESQEKRISRARLRSLHSRIHKDIDTAGRLDALNDESDKIIHDFVKKDESLSEIFKKNNIDMVRFRSIARSMRSIFDPKDIRTGMSYLIRLNKSSDIVQFRYAIDKSSFLEVNRSGKGYNAQKVSVPKEIRYGIITGEIKTNLFDAIGNSKMNTTVAYDLADLFAYDVDFATDLRKGDTFKIVVEEIYSDNVFVRYGRILYAELTNNGHQYEAVWYESKKTSGYFDPDGRSLVKTISRAPLRFRYISSHFTLARFHPILKIYRPHLGVDYAADAGTPVSAAGEGVIEFAGYKGDLGNSITISHFGGYSTYYGHMMGFADGIKAGDKVKQGQIIGYVGQTGLATGPHLDYKVSLNGTFINPLTMKIVGMDIIPAKAMKDYKKTIAKLKREFSTLYASTEAYR